MITKDQLKMTNNELEARVIELETQLKFAQNEADVMCLKCDEALDAGVGLQERYDALEAEIVEVAASRPAIPYDEWYRNLHPGGPGSNPDLRYLEATKYDRILA